MSNITRLIAIIGFVGALSACAREQPTEEYVAVEPISSEPTYTGKYK